MVCSKLNVTIIKILPQLILKIGAQMMSLPEMQDQIPNMTEN